MQQRLTNQLEDKGIKTIIIIKNEKGLHTRPSTEFVRCAASFDSKITLQYRKTIANGKSLLGILMLAAPKGAKIEVEAIGKDAEKAIQALIKLSEQKFYIQY